jgi:modification methylase
MIANNIILGDCLDKLSEIKDNTIDLIFADPPYNLQLNKTLYRPDSSLVKGLQNVEWDKFSSFEEYDIFTLKWLKECKRVLKPAGCLWVIGSYHNIFRLGYAIQNLDFWILNDIVWRKNNPMPNFKGTRFTNAHELLIWATKEKTTKNTFNYSSMKIFNDDKQMQSIWDIAVCKGEERLKNNKITAHPTQKPIELLIRILLSSTNKGDTVLDPFLGSGTTGVVAKMLGCNFIGIEKNEEYYNLAKERIESTKPIENNLLAIKPIKITSRVSLAMLIESKLLKVGQKIFSHNKSCIAELCIDGSLVTKVNKINYKGSIHSLAKDLSKSSKNGWDFWFYLDNENKIKSINYLRLQYLNLL